jgi:hypothetical protein
LTVHPSAFTASLAWTTKFNREWDSNGQALWAISRFDRIRGASYGFGEGLFGAIVEGARWIGRNRDGLGLLHSGWSAEHVGDRDKPHYWDDFWALAGLWEAAQLGTRLGAPNARDDLESFRRRGLQA